MPTEPDGSSPAPALLLPVTLHVCGTDPTALEVKVELARRTDSVPPTRAFLTGLLTGWHVPPGSIDDAALLTTELLANAVTYGRGRVLFEVCLEHLTHGATLHVRVLDDGLAAPHLDLVSDDSEHGRGLLLVEALAERWGTEPAVDGDGDKTVWFDLAISDTCATTGRGATTSTDSRAPISGDPPSQGERRG